MTRAALLNAYLITGQLDGIRSVLAEMYESADLPPVLASLARGTAIILATHEGGPLADASEVLGASPKIMLGVACPTCRCPTTTRP